MTLTKIAPIVKQFQDLSPEARERLEWFHQLAPVAQFNRLRPRMQEPEILLFEKIINNWDNAHLTEKSVVKALLRELDQHPE